MERFISECLTTKVDLNPWPHQIIQDTFSIETFTKLRKQCEEKLNFETKELLHIFPNDFKKWGIDFYDETLDICKKLLQNEGILAGSSSGTLLAAAIKYCRAHKVKKNVVTLICDAGDKYLRKIYNESWRIKEGLNFKYKYNIFLVEGEI